MDESDSGLTDLTVLEVDLVEGMQMVSLEHYSGFKLRFYLPVDLQKKIEKIDHPISLSVTDRENAILREKLYSIRHLKHFTAVHSDLLTYCRIIKPTVESFNCRDIVWKDPIPKNTWTILK